MEPPCLVSSASVAGEFTPELAVRCPTCNSQPGEKCASLITALYRDEVHAARRELANKTSEVP